MYTTAWNKFKVNTKVYSSALSDIQNEEIQRSASQNDANKFVNNDEIYTTNLSKFIYENSKFMYFRGTQANSKRYK